MASRDLKLADPQLQQAFSVLSQRFTVCFPKYKIIVVTTYRSPEEQLVEFKAHRSDKDGTNEKSKHNYFPSQAIDVMIVRISDNALIDTLLDMKLFDEDLFYSMYWILGLWAQMMGLRAGYDWNGDLTPEIRTKGKHLNDPYHWETK